MKWISVTGLDGAGKTTLVRDLEKYYTNKGLNVVTAHLPFDKHLQRIVLPSLKSAYADRLLFALDNHIVATKIAEWESEYDLLISQRGFFDSFVHGAVQGFSYDYIATLNQIDDLPEVDIMVHLVASASVAFERIKNDPDADKFEYPRYIRKQEAETRRGFYELENGNADLSAFSNSKNVLIDTTKLSTAKTFEIAKSFCDSTLDEIGYDM